MSTDPGPGPKKKKSVTLNFKMGQSKRSFKAADERTGAASYGKESMTKSTPEFVKTAQKAGVDVAEHEGRPYRAGYTSITKEPDKFSISIEKTTPNIPKPKKGAYETLLNKQKMQEIHQKSGPGMKQRRPRVEYLQGHGYGRNKRTESGY